MHRNYKRLETEIMAKIFCPHCQKPVSIRTSDQLTNTTREVYANCNNELCLSRPVFIISHSHDTQPPIGTILSPSQQAINMLKTLKPEHQLDILEELKKMSPKKSRAI